MNSGDETSWQISQGPFSVLRLEQHLDHAEDLNGWGTKVQCPAASGPLDCEVNSMDWADTFDWSLATPVSNIGARALFPGGFADEFLDVSSTPLSSVPLLEGALYCPY